MGSAIAVEMTRARLTRVWCNIFSCVQFSPIFLKKTFFMLTSFPDKAELHVWKWLHDGVQNSPECVFSFGPEWRPVSKAAGPQARRVLSCLTCCSSNLSTSAVPHSSALCVWAWTRWDDPSRRNLLLSVLLSTHVVSVASFSLQSSFDCSAVVFTPLSSTQFREWR